ncbi:hypothetical protein K5I29_04025 [Flavobacterium agricola]|uniref:XRE family transcriptional regulator n=1 Tax=Flavobacterium agricola TaxID=2870839 RepID=A0ABY6M443_9FLAO|nr:hypothetical protein [Flavobacterium agricola]UYW02076.1 hypothetical protein K5I29_04025 [Flavobacterium agricola]
MYDCDKRMIEVIEYLIAQKKVKNKRWFCLSIDMTPETYYKILKGINHFTTVQIQKTCDLYKVNANYIFGIEDNMFYKK